MSLRSQIGRVLGVKAVRAWEQRRQPQQSLAKPSDYHKAILTLSEGNSLIREALIAGGPYLATSGHGRTRLHHAPPGDPSR